MITLDLTQKTKANLTSCNLNRAVKPYAQTYTYEKINGNLAEEMSSMTAVYIIEEAPISSLEPEDFEATYHWFIS
jgi:hypothetical protein